MASLNLKQVTFKEKKTTPKPQRKYKREQPPLGQSDIIVLLVRKHSQQGTDFLVLWGFIVKINREKELWITDNREYSCLFYRSFSFLSSCFAHKKIYKKTLGITLSNASRIFHGIQTQISKAVLLAVFQRLALPLAWRERFKEIVLKSTERFITVRG